MCSVFSLLLTLFDADLVAAVAELCELCVCCCVDHFNRHNDVAKTRVQAGTFS